MTGNVFIIAEAGVNHNGDINIARKMIDVAAESGVDAIKFQTFKSEKLVSMNTQTASYQKKNIKSNISQLQMLKKLELNYDDYKSLKDYCIEKDLMFLSSPFDYESIDFLDELMSIYKVPSGEIYDEVFLRKIASKGKKIILSTGMTYLKDIERALGIIKDENPQVEVVLLHCTTNYPTPFEEVNLNAMDTLRDAFKVTVGYSDHTLGIEVPIAAVAKGAKVIEKHFTLDKTMDGPDHKASLEPDELKSMVVAIRNIEVALGSGLKEPNKSELEIMNKAKKRIVANKYLKKGQKISIDDIVFKRSNSGMFTEDVKYILNKIIIQDVEEDSSLEWSDFMEE